MFPFAHMGLPLVPFLAGGRVPKWAPLIAFGGLLPDLIDKPLGHLVLSGDNGRIFAHTLVFAIALLLTGAVWGRMMPVAYGVLSHHLIDCLFLEPGSMMWPLFGAFPTSDFDYTIWIDHLSQPLVLCGEALGLALMVWWALGRVRSRGPVSKTIYN